MEIEKAIKILEEFVNIDRSMRSEAEYFSDYDKFCEERCVAIENLIKGYKELQKENKTLKDIYFETVIRQNQENKKEATEYKIYMSKEDNKEE